MYSPSSIKKITAPSNPRWMRPAIWRFNLEIGAMSAPGTIVSKISISLGCFFPLQIEPVRAMRVILSNLTALLKNHFAANSSAPRSVLRLGWGADASGAGECCCDGIILRGHAEHRLFDVGQTGGNNFVGFGRMEGAKLLPQRLHVPSF